MTSMLKCDKNCKPDCDFCTNVIHDHIQVDDGHYITSGPSGCLIHSNFDEIYNSNGYCDDFTCFNISKDVSQ